MEANNKDLAEYYKIIRQFIKCHAEEGDADSARQAVDAITPAAERGDIKAQMLLGKYYSCGYHSEYDNQKAIHWYENAADKGNQDAAMLIMKIYRNDYPDDIDAVQRNALILKWHRRWFDILATKANKGSADAAQTLMRQYVEDCPEDMASEDGVATARKWYDRWIEILTAKAAKGGSVDKMKLADTLLYADGVPEELLDWFSDQNDKRSLLQAIALYKEVTADSDFYLISEVYFRIGCAYDDLGEEKKALTSFKKAARMNCHETFAKIGDAYRYGKGVVLDDTIARRWYKKGADVGEITATLNLAGCYKNGIGGEQDYAKAMIAYQHIAARTGSGFKEQSAGIGTALYEIGNMYLKGLSVKVDLRKAYDYFRRAASHYNSSAENALNNKGFRDFK